MGKVCVLFLFFFYCSSAKAQELPMVDYKQFNNKELDSLIKVEANRGNYTISIAYTKELRARIGEAVGVQDTFYGNFTNKLAFLYSHTGKLEEAKTLFLEAKEIYANSFGTEHVEYAAVIDNIGTTYRKIGDYKQAELFLLESKRIRAKILGVESPTYAITLNNLAVLYYYMGRYADAEAFYLENKEINAKTVGVNHPEYVNTLANLAALYYKNQRYEEAEPLYLEVSNIMKKVLGDKHPKYANKLNNLMALYLRMERYKEVEELFSTTEAIIKEKLGLTHPMYAASLNFLAISYTRRERHEEALVYYLRAKKIIKDTKGVKALKYGTVLSYIASCYVQLGRYEEAIQLYQEAKAIKEEVVGKEHEEYINCLNKIGHTYLSAGKGEQARAFLMEALEAGTGVNGNTVISNSWSDSLLAVNYASISHLEEALTSLGHLYQLSQKRTSETAKKAQLILSNTAHSLFKKIRNRHTNNASKLRTLAQSNVWTLRSLKLLTEEAQLPMAFDIAEDNKSVLLLESTKAEKAYRLGSLPDSLAAQEADLMKKRDGLQADLIKRRPKAEKDSLRTILNSVNQEIRSFVAQIETTYPNYASLKYEKDNATVALVKASLDAKTALLEYVISDSILYLFYIDKEEAKELRVEITETLLSKKIKKLHHALSNYKFLASNPKKAYEEYVNTAYWFYEKLIAPAQIDPQKINHLIIIPDGELGHLPFETFLVKREEQRKTSYANLHYLLNDYQVSYNYSATLWNENKQQVRSVNNGQILAMAANYGTTLDSSMINLRSRLPVDQTLRGQLQPLLAAQKEVRILENNFKGYFGFDKGASEKVFKEKASEYAVIHLAMHGILDKRHPVLSSLAFTEDGDSIENNFLQAYEISNLKLNADLVILSACETGFGDFEKGNGIASLARAFMYAGTSSMVMTLWQVHDVATAEIMKRLYHNLSEGMNKAEALRQAKLDFIKQAGTVVGHPAFWSPFVLVGNDAPITLTSKGSWWWKIAMGLTVSALLGIIMIGFRKGKEIA